MNRTWHYAVIWSVAFGVAEALVRSGIQPGWLCELHSLVSIAAYDVPTERRSVLATHLIAQTLALPAYAYVNQKVISQAVSRLGDITWKEIAAGLITTTVLACITYMPTSGSTNTTTHRLRIFHFLVERSNIAYGLTIALCMFGISLGFQLVTMGVAAKVRSPLN